VKEEEIEEEGLEEEKEVALLSSKPPIPLLALWL
jgi:hypothetical protein